ncbi:MAG: hypothetical protein MP439_05585 [Ferrimicrobium sp.]|jgi:ppGpp synthetase/RelA/SpoT-type nucleotidyltranferase|nr:hypothetical protein [Ferrimicrobium sp.]
MTAIDLMALRERYQAEQPRYQALAASVVQQLHTATRQHGLPCSVEGRAKDTASFLKKALRKDYASPWDDIHDKAGVRVITLYQSHASEVEQIIRNLFHVRHYEDKRRDLPPDRLRYLGVHFEVSVPDEGNPPRSTEDAGELVCEIQLHTQAQNLWATVSHELLYKPVQEAPSEVARGVYRLMALLELFDGEVERGRDQIRRLPGYEEARMLTILEQQFWTLVARPTDVDLSKRIITVLLPLIGSDNASDYKSTLDTFVETHREKLDEIFADYAEDDRNVLLSQPECLLVFERLTVDPFALVDVWQRHLPTDLLTSLSEVWGTPVTL